MINILPRFCWTLHKQHLIFLCEFETFIVGDWASEFVLFLLIIKIRFIADQHDSYFVIGVVFCLVHPFVDVLEWLSVCDVVHQNYPNRSSIVWTGYRFESFLASLNMKYKNTVSQICNLICFPPACISLDPNSTPMVVSWSNLNFFSRNWSKMQDFPTPKKMKNGLLVSPMTMYLKR